MPRGDEGCSMQTVQSAQERPEKNRTRHRRVTTERKAAPLSVDHVARSKPMTGSTAYRLRAGWASRRVKSSANSATI
jgi:hypothetical protein